MKNINSLRRLVLASAGLLLVLLLGSPAHAAMIPGYPDNVTDYDSRELALLPTYCLYAQGFPKGNSPEHKRMVEKVGFTFTHIHHYCRGLIKTNRAKFLAPDRQVRLFYLNDAVKEYGYVIDRSPVDFVLLPEILTKRAENLLLLGNVMEGMRDLTRALDVKPDYWPPYAYASDHYKEIGNLAQAREWLEKGLSQLPGSQPLEKRLADLNTTKGKPKISPESTKKAASEQRPAYKPEIPPESQPPAEQ